MVDEGILLEDGNYIFVGTTVIRAKFTKAMNLAVAGENVIFRQFGNDRKLKYSFKLTLCEGETCEC